VLWYLLFPIWYLLLRTDYMVLAIGRSVFTIDY